jgi:hypothetical protein
MATYLQTGGAISMSDINGVFGRGTSLSNYLGTSYYTVSGGPFTFPGGPISFNNFYGTGPDANISISLASLGSFFGAEDNYTGSNVQGELDFNTDGTWNWYGVTNYANGSWATPNSGGIGSSYWIRFTRTAFSDGLYAYATASTGWMQLSSIRSIIVGTPLPGTITSEYTIEISSSSSGSPVLATNSNLEIDVTVNA